MRNCIFILFVFVFMACKTKPIPVDVPALNIEPMAMVQDWVGGMERGGSGTYFFVFFKKALPEGVQLKKVTFNNKVGYFDTDNGLHFQANLIDDSYDLDADPKKEANNNPPILQDNLNNAVLHFTYNGKAFTQQPTYIERKATLTYPSMKGEPTKLKLD